MTIFIKILLVAPVGLLAMQAPVDGRAGKPDGFTAAFSAWIEAKEKEDVCGFSWFGYGEIAATIERATAAFFPDSDADSEIFQEELETAARVASISGYAAAVNGPCQVQEVTRSVEDAEDTMMKILEAAEEK